MPPSRRDNNKDDDEISLTIENAGGHVTNFPFLLKTTKQKAAIAAAKQRARHKAISRRKRKKSFFHWRTIHHEARLLSDLAVPTIILQLGLIWSGFITASHVGRKLGSLYLDAFTLGNLTGNLFVSSLLQGIFSASDTLSPQAFGAGNERELGLLAMRGFVASMFIMLPIVTPLCFWLEDILILLHQDPTAAKMAKEWFQIYSIGLPFYAITMMMWRFCSAQEVMAPQVIYNIVTNAMLLPVFLQLSLEWFGFLGSAVAITAYSIVHAGLLWLHLWYFQPHTPDSWPGLSKQTWKEALEWEPMWDFIHLGFGGMLCFSEWVYWELLVLMAGTLGVVPLSVQTISNMVVEVGCMFPIGVGIALAIRIGTIMSVNVRRAKLLAAACLACGVIVFGLMSLLLYTQQERIVGIFTVEESVLEGCSQIWWKVSFLHFNIGIYGIVMGIATGLGMQWTLGIASFVALIVLGTPAAYYFALIEEGGLASIWTWMNPPYMMINAILLIALWHTDWDAISAEIIEREGADDEDNNFENGNGNGSINERGYGSMTETTSLLPNGNNKATTNGHVEYQGKV